MTLIYKSEHAAEVREVGSILRGLGFQPGSRYQGYNCDYVADDGRMVTIRSMGTDLSQLILIRDGEMVATSLVGVERSAKDGLLRLFAAGTDTRAPKFPKRDVGPFGRRTDPPMNITGVGVVTPDP